METQITTQQSFDLSPVGQMIKQFEVTQRIGDMYAKSTIVPEIYKGNVANCAIATEMALRMNINPIAVMQNLSIVQGKPSWSSKFLISCINTCGKYKPLKFKEWIDGKVGIIKIKEKVYNPVTGRNETTEKEIDCNHIDNYCCQAWTTAKDNDEKLEGVTIDLRMAVSEGWYTKHGSKWPTMTHLMLRYRAASMWVNTNDPSISMGIMTQEEAQDVEWADYEEIPAKKMPANKAERMEMMKRIAAQAAEAKDDPAPRTAQETKNARETSEPGHSNDDLFAQDANINA